MKRFRIYIDESGDHTYHHLDSLASRYLSLTGVVIESELYRTQLQPEFEKLKQSHFPHSPDEPVILHRKEMINREGIFGALRDADRDQAFTADLVRFLSAQDYAIYTVVIDKKAHTDRYGKAASHPYHYCLTVLLERYRGFLTAEGGRGDVMAESRGGTEDMELKKVYQELYSDGTQFLSAQSFQGVLTSRELKLKKKIANIAGLQMADLLAYPIKQDILTKDGIAGVSQGDFGEKLCASVQRKQNIYSRKFLK